MTRGMGGRRGRQAFTGRRQGLAGYSPPHGTGPVDADQTRRAWRTAAAMKLANSGWGSKGLDRSSG